MKCNVYYLKQFKYTKYLKYFNHIIIKPKYDTLARIKELNEGRDLYLF